MGVSDSGERSTNSDAARDRISDVDASCSFNLLGVLEVSAPGGTLDLGPPKQRALLAALILHANEILSSDRLIELLWGDSPPRTAAHSVQIYVSELRKSLATLPRGAAIETIPPGYRLRVDDASVDIFRFERLVERGVEAGRGTDTAVAIARLSEALALWRGDPLQEFAYAEFAQRHIRRLEGRRCDALEELAAAELAAGHVRDAVRHAELLHELEPLRERAVELLMLGLYRSGRHVQALRAYQAHRKFLADELGVMPSPALQRLNEQVLLHDAALEPESRDAVNLARLHRPARNPYKGLRPFREVDAGDFFGRDALVERMLAELATGRRLIALVGPSGCGKSSVVAAGLVPALRAAGSTVPSNGCTRRSRRACSRYARRKLSSPRAASGRRRAPVSAAGHGTGASGAGRARRHARPAGDRPVRGGVSAPTISPGSGSSTRSRDAVSGSGRAGIDCAHPARRLLRPAVAASRLRRAVHVRASSTCCR